MRNLKSVNHIGYAVKEITPPLQIFNEGGVGNVRDI